MVPRRAGAVVRRERLHQRLLDRIVARGDGFNPLGRPAAGELERLWAALTAAGRDPGTLELVGGVRDDFPGPDAVADLGLALASIGPQREQGFTTFCLKPSQFTDDPGAVAVVFADWQSCSDTFEELLDPVRAQCREAFVVVRCRWRGELWSRCVYIWVDKDFALARGWHQGYPKKLGSMRGYEAESSPVWSGDAELALYPSPAEELLALTPRAMIGGFYRSVGFSWNGGTLLDQSRSAAPDARPHPPAW